MGGLGVVRGIIGGVAGAAGDPQTQQRMDALNQQEKQQKQNELQAKIAPLALGVKNLQTGIQGAYAQYQQAHPEFQGDFDQWKTGPGAQQFNQFLDQSQHAVHSMREILHPDWKPGPTDWLKTHLTDRAHLSNADHRAEDHANDAAWNQYDERQGVAKVANIVPPDEQPAAVALKKKEAQAQALEAQKLTGQEDLAAQKAEAAQKLEEQKAQAAQVIEDKKTSSSEKIAAQRQLEQNRVEDDRQKRFFASQERIEKEHGKASPGTWSVQEDENGKPVLFNSKTGQTQDAPAGMHKSGYYAKQVAPLAAAEQNVGEYMQNGVFTGPGDLDLQHQYFTATQPATGFRMTKVQQDILAGSQSWMNSVQGKLHHATTGTWFSDEQRRQIADEAQKAISAKKKALAGGGPQTDQLRKTQGGPSDDDIIKALSGSK